MTSAKRRLISVTREISALVKNGDHREALVLLSRLREVSTVDSFVYPLALNCCAALRLPAAAAALHALAAKSGLLHGNPFVSSALIDAYAKCFSPFLSYAQNLFDELPVRNSVVWSSIIAAYARSGDYLAAGEIIRRMDAPPLPSAFNAVVASATRKGDASAAFSLLKQMQERGIRPTVVTALALLPICFVTSSLHIAGEIHAFSIRNSFLPDIRLSSTLVEIYGRCGCPGYSTRVFDKVDNRDVVMWSALVSAYAFNGLGDAAMAAFKRMGVSGLEPDGVMFLAVMKACTHAGMPDQAKKYMDMMMNEYGMHPGNDHYACLVDAMARAGRLDEARRVVDQMPGKGSAKAWGALLGASRIHGNVLMAETAARALMEIEPGNAANLVILSSVYAAAGMHEAAEQAREEIQSLRMQRAPGSSWVSELES